MKTIPLLDSRIVAQAFALRRVVQHPVLVSEDVVPGDTQAYGSVLRDRKGVWRMWYLGPPIYCEYYAESEDGLKWVRPHLDLVAPEVRGEVDGPNAFLCRNQKDVKGAWLVGSYGPEGFCVLDAEEAPHPAAKARFTALYLARTETESGMYIAHSDDGTRWVADSGMPVIPGWRDTSSVFFFDKRRQKYVWYGRPEAYAAPSMHANRLLAYRESEDLTHWTPDRTVLDTDDADADPHHLLDERALHGGQQTIATAEQRAQVWAELTEGQTPDTDRPLVRGRNRQWYGITAFPYADLYAGIVWMYDLPTGSMWTELLHSYDGVDWRREAIRVPFLEAIPGTCMCTMASPPVDLAEETRLYYSVSNQSHHRVPNPSVKKGIRIAALRRDRWVGYVAGDVQGELLTQVMEKPRDLTLNAHTEGDGWVRVEVDDADGRVIDGFSADECVPFSGDDLGWRPTWKSGKGVDLLAGQMVRLRISARRASLFALHT